MCIIIIHIIYLLENVKQETVKCMQEFESQAGLDTDNAKISNIIAHLFSQAPYPCAGLITMILASDHTTKRGTNHV